MADIGTAKVKVEADLGEFNQALDHALKDTTRLWTIPRSTGERVSARQAEAVADRLVEIHKKFDGTTMSEETRTSLMSCIAGALLR